MDRRRLYEVLDLGTSIYTPPLERTPGGMVVSRPLVYLVCKGKGADTYIVCIGYERAKNKWTAAHHEPEYQMSWSYLLNWFKINKVDKVYMQWDNSYIMIDEDDLQTTL